MTRAIDTGPTVRLTNAQMQALSVISLARPVAGNDDGWVMPECARPTLGVLERRRLIERQGYDAQGVMCGPGLCRLTPAGRSALAASAGSRSDG